MKISSMKKSLLDYAIKGHLTSKFRRENPTLSAFAEIESFNAEIKQKRDLTQKALKKLESNLKNANKKSKNPLPFANADSQKSPSLAEGDLGGGLDKPLTKQEIKAEIATLKKELSKLKEIEVLNLTPPKTPPPSPLPQGEGESMVSPHAKKGESKEKSSRAIKEAFSLNSPTFTNSNSQKSLAGDVHTASPSPCGRGLGGGVNSPMSAIKPLTSELNSLNNGANPFPFPIPASWAWVKLGDIVEIISGTSYGKSDLSDNQGIRILRGGNINDNNAQIDLFADDVFVASNLQDSEKIVQKDDILIVASTGSSRVIGKPAFAKKDFENTQIGAFLRIIRVKNKDFAKYTQYIFMSAIYRQYISDLASGTNILNIKNEYIENFKIPLPPLQEQKAIAQKLEILVNLANDFERTQEELKRIEKRIEKSLLKYAIEGHLSKRFRRENPALSAFAEIESFNADIKQKRDLTQKTLKKLESSLKHEKDKDKKANLKAKITALKKELSKLREIEVLNLTPPQTPPPSPLPQGEGESMVVTPAMEGELEVATHAKGELKSPSIAHYDKSHHRQVAPYMREFSREMRQNPTQAELKLWQVLRGKKLGMKFRRQFVINDKYIADFVCLEKRLIIECDGGQHNENFSDAKRDFYLQSQDFYVLRFWNNEILDNIEGVIWKIKEVLDSTTPIRGLTPPQTPPARGGAFSMNSLVEDSHTNSPSLAEDAHIVSPSHCGRGLGGGVNSLTSEVNPLTNELNPLNNEANPFPFPIPASWAWVRLGDIVEIISGTSYGKSDLSDNQGIRILRGGNIGKNTRELELKSDDVFVNKNLENSDKNIRQNDIIITGTNDLANIAKCAFVKTDLESTQIGAFLRIVRARNSDFAKLAFYILSSDSYEKYLQSCVSGTVTTLLNVKNEYIENFKIPIPPLQEQKAIALRLESLFNISKGLKAE